MTAKKRLSGSIPDVTFYCLIYITLQSLITTLKRAKVSLVWYKNVYLTSFSNQTDNNRIVSSSYVPFIKQAIKDRQGVSGRCGALGHINSQLWQL